MDNEYKSCPGCKAVKYLDEFYKDKGTKDKRCSHCKSCMKKYKETHKQDQREYQNRPENKLRAKKLDQINNLKSYGLTLEQYDQMFEEQNGVCAICELPEIRRRLSVDHNHETGKVRGLLCFICNTRLGIIENDTFATQVKGYLKKYAS